jgi:CHAT domain-containing protein
MSNYDPTDPKWDSDAALENVKMERSVRGDMTNEALTRQLLEEAGPQAAMSIIHLAVHGTNENTRLNAAKYVTDNLINEGASTTKQKWEDLVGEAVSDAELHANYGSAD